MTVLMTRPTSFGDDDGEHGPQVVVLALCEEEFSADLEFDLRGRLEVVLANRPRRVVLDLAGCHYLDAPGLRVLLDASSEAAEHGALLEVRNCSPEVLRLLQAAGEADRLGARA